LYLSTLPSTIVFTKNHIRVVYSDRTTTAIKQFKKEIHTSIKKTKEINIYIN
jgi:hypothetical protein